MQIDKFMSLISSGFDVSFNYKDVFYTISLIGDNEMGKLYGIGSDNTSIGFRYCNYTIFSFINTRIK